MASARELRNRKQRFVEKLAAYLERRSNDMDVTFIVGPSKEKVRALKIIMKAASPAIEKLFDETWDCGVLKEGNEGIHLPNVDPQAFKVFLKLLLADDWCTEEIRAMKLSPETIFNLIAITKQFEMPDMEMPLQLLAEDICKEISTFVKTQEFLQLSVTNLETILSSDLLPLNETEVFNSAKRWAEDVCSKSKAELEPTGDNLRHALGPALFQIRFPLMTTTEFADLVSPTGILTDVEEVQIYRYVAQSKNKSEESRNASRLSFSTKTREGNILVDEIDSTLVHPSRRSFKSKSNAVLNVEEPTLATNSEGIHLTLNLQLKKIFEEKLSKFVDCYPSRQLRSVLKNYGSQVVDEVTSYDVTIFVYKPPEDNEMNQGYELIRKVDTRIQAEESTDVIISFDHAAIPLEERMKILLEENETNPLAFPIQNYKIQIEIKS